VARFLDCDFVVNKEALRSEGFWSSGRLKVVKSFKGEFEETMKFI
jgi:hypothetical protein